MQGMLISKEYLLKLFIDAIYSSKVLVDLMWFHFFKSSTKIFLDTVNSLDVGIYKRWSSTVFIKIYAEESNKEWSLRKS